MSFWPVPKTVAELLRSARSHGPAFDLGAGSGDLARVFERIGVRCALLDRDLSKLSMASPASHRICGEVQHLPLRGGCAGALVAGNVFRHLQPSVRELVGVELARVLSPQGIAVVLEDDPLATSGDELNYRTALELLAAADPSRGAALAPSVVRAALASALGEPIAVGKARNELPIEDAMAPVRWLETRLIGASPERRLRVAELRATVSEYGMAYGRFWFLVYRRSAA